MGQASSDVLDTRVFHESPGSDTVGAQARRRRGRPEDIIKWAQRAFRRHPVEESVWARDGSRTVTYTLC
jgi:hypothetical protein